MGTSARNISNHAISGQRNTNLALLVVVVKRLALLTVTRGLLKLFTVKVLVDAEGDVGFEPESFSTRFAVTSLVVL